MGKKFLSVVILSCLSCHFNNLNSVIHSTARNISQGWTNQLICWNPGERCERYYAQDTSFQWPLAPANTKMNIPVWTFHEQTESPWNTREQLQNWLIHHIHLANVQLFLWFITHMINVLEYKFNKTLLVQHRHLTKDFTHPC